MPYNNTEVGAHRPMLQERIKVPQPVRSVESIESNGGFAGCTPLPMSSSALFFGDAGKQHFPPHHSETYKHIPGRRILHPNPSGEEKTGGLKSIKIPIPHKAPRAQQRHLPKDQARSGYDVPEHSIEKALNRKILVRRESGHLARDYISTEVTLDMQFGIKKKCDDGIRQQRNNIPVANPGDKLYAAVEYSPGFYKEFNSSFSRVGGRIGTGGAVRSIPPPGEAKRHAAERDTSMGFNPAAMTNTMGRNDTLNFRPRLSYEEKIKIQQTKDAVNEVAELTEGTVTAMNEDGLSWEQKTGLFVWETKAEREAKAKAAEGGDEEKKE